MSEQRINWIEARRRSAGEAIVDAAWAIVRDDGLAGLALRDLARRAGITTPTVYAYFDSKNSIYDAMFERAATEFDEQMRQPYDTSEPHAVLVAGVRRFVEFCTSDIARYQLLFQHAIPDFEPRPESLAPAARALDFLRERLADNGVTDPRHVDMWTALTTGLVDQQISNDRGGDRWTRLIDDFVDMFFGYCQPSRQPSKRVKLRPMTGEDRS